MLFNTTNRMTPKNRFIKFIKGLWEYPCPNCGAKEYYPFELRIQGNDHCFCWYCKKINPISDLLRKKGE